MQVTENISSDLYSRIQVTHTVYELLSKNFKVLRPFSICALRMDIVISLWNLLR